MTCTTACARFGIRARQRSVAYVGQGQAAQRHVQAAACSRWGYEASSAAVWTRAMYGHAQLVQQWLARSMWTGTMLTLEIQWCLNGASA